MPATPGTVHREAVQTNARVGIYLALAALTWIVFGQTLGHQFVRYDDPTYVYENAEITAGLTAHGIVAAFTHFHAQNWHPLTTLSHMLDCQLFGLNPAGHHLTNVLLHTAAVLLLFSALNAMTGALWRSAFVAAVFAIHPLRAESVAWVAERKDVLSAVFFMLTLGAYVRYARHPSLKRYLAVAMFFALGLMSKPMLVTLPVLLLLLDYWPFARFQDLASGWPNDQSRPPPKVRFLVPPKLIVEKIPLLFLSLFSAIVTLAAQGQTVGYSEPLPFTWRLSNGLVSYVAYIGQMIWPAKLAVFYPHAADHLSGWEIMLAFFFIGGLTALAVALRPTRPYFFVGWSWYLICLLPVIGVIQVGLQGRADRYTYLAQIGLYIALTWTVADLSSRLGKGRRVLPIAAVVIIGALAWRARIQTSYWSDTESLWNHALAISADNDLAHYNVAAFLMEHGQVDEAIAHYEKALNLRPNNGETHYHLSIALLHNNLANALARKGQLDEAIVHYRKALELRDDFADAHSNLAAVLVQKGQTAEAIAHYERALAIPPEDADSHLRLAAVLLQTGREDEAIAQYRRALEIAPNSIAALNALASALARSVNLSVKNPQEAVVLAEKANELSHGKNPTVLRTLAASYAASKRFVEAIKVARSALLLTREPVLVNALEREIKRYENGDTE